MKLMNKKDILQKARYESFGGIISTNNPPSLVYVDREFMKETGYDFSPLWSEPQKHLSAPTEVHFNITNRCPYSCKHCTTNAGSSCTDLPLASIKRIIDTLAEMKVFHIAFGGGELFTRPDAIEIAVYARSKNIIPNATTNGFYMTQELAEKCRVFGQINVSMDGIGEKYGIIRGVDGFEQADKAVKLLVDAGVNTGLNCVVTRGNFDSLEEVVSYASNNGLREVLFIRLKPSGRAAEIYEQHKPTFEQNKSFFKLLLRMAKKYKLNIQADCSFIPHICYHRPSPKVMQLFGVEGCQGGNVLLGVRHDGFFNSCSHYMDYFEDVNLLPEVWDKHPHLKQFRERKVTDQICTKCSYFSICKGGCPLFSQYKTGDFNQPDPECPILEEMRQLSNLIGSK